MQQDQPMFVISFLYAGVVVFFFSSFCRVQFMIYVTALLPIKISLTRRAEQQAEK